MRLVMKYFATYLLGIDNIQGESFFK